MSTCEVCVNSVAAAGWAWSGGKGVEQYVLDEEMLHNSLQKKGLESEMLQEEWIVYAWIVVVVHSEDFFGLELAFVLYVWTSQPWCWNTSKNARFRMPFPNYTKFALHLP